MRVLVATDDERLRSARVEALQRLEYEVAGACGLVRLASEVRALQPDVLLLDGLEGAEDARSALRRARGATQRRLGALLLLREGATWLRVPLPRDAQPAAVLRSAGLEDAALRRALEQVRATAGVKAGTVRGYDVTLDRRSREAWTDFGRTRLTEAEAIVLEVLLERPSEIVRHDDLARALHGRVLTDSRTRAAIDGQVASLRKRLEPLQVADQLQAVRTAGYRFVERRRPRIPPRR
jgi:DNA-binding response OmpR family regulator